MLSGKDTDSQGNPILEAARAEGSIASADRREGGARFCASPLCLTVALGHLKHHLILQKIPYNCNNSALLLKSSGAELAIGNGPLGELYVVLAISAPELAPALARREVGIARLEESQPRKHRTSRPPAPCSWAPRAEAGILIPIKKV
jgi:hypothetical protein